MAEWPARERRQAAHSSNKHGKKSKNITVKHNQTTRNTRIIDGVIALQQSSTANNNFNKQSSQQQTTKEKQTRAAKKNSDNKQNKNDKRWN